MAWQKQKTHSAAEYKMLNLAEVGYGGLNIQDLDYTLPLNQSPRMLNMMVKNGAFGKRYGQENKITFASDIKAMMEYKGFIYVHVGTDILKVDMSVSTPTYSTMYTNADLDVAGNFFKYNKRIYFLSPKIYLECDGTEMKKVEPYCPDVLINRTPDGTQSDVIDDYNRLGAGFKNSFNPDGTATEFVVMIPKSSDDDTAGLDATPIKVEIDGVDYTEGDGSGKIVSVDRATGKVTFDTAPAHGQNTVVITAYKTDQVYINSIMNSKYFAVYGGQNNSRLFVAGNGSSTYFYSDVFDASYFPETNDAVVGNAETDITGFGSQYNVLIVFKPSEIYAIDYQYATDTTGEQKAMFFTTQVNADIGCDMPKTIKYVDNRLTWGSTRWGILTLCSTVIEDERNVRVVSRNINGGYRNDGLLAEPNLENAVAMSYDGKYIVCCNGASNGSISFEYRDDDDNLIRVIDSGGHAYSWDYTISPYSSSDRVSPDDAAKNTAWFKWDNFFMSAYVILNRKLYFARGDSIGMLNNTYYDFGGIIPSFYRTPLMDFDAYHMLKTVKKAFFEVRGDTPCRIRIKYITDEDADGEQDPEDIEVAVTLWDAFGWDTFGYTTINFAKTFTRKCSIKKINLFAIELTNNEIGRDMSLSGIRCEYTLVKEIK